MAGETPEGRVLHAAAVVNEAKAFAAIAVRVRNLGEEGVFIWIISVCYAFVGVEH